MYHYQDNFLSFLEKYPNLKELKESKMTKLSSRERRVLEIYLTRCATVEIILINEPFPNVTPLYLKKTKDIVQIQKQYKISIMTDHQRTKITAFLDNIHLIKKDWSTFIKKPKDLIFNKPLSKRYNNL
jgi:ABC-type lipopolysaccharide export system ATPase subunit